MVERAMIPDRYPAPNATKYFGPEYKIARWARFTIDYADTSINRDATLDGAVKAAFIKELMSTEIPTPEAVATREQVTGHDVVAFLSLFTQNMSPGLKRHIHYGLTSSDLVENAHFDSMRMHALSTVVHIGALSDQMRRWQMKVTVRAGRTHGQIADVTSWNHQLFVLLGTLDRIRIGLNGYGSDFIVKSMGPTGRSLFNDGRDTLVASVHNGRVVESTQVIPRDYQLVWAAMYLRLAVVLENLALLVRLGARSEVEEVAEGAAEKRVGSSAMPLKKNPIDSEKVCGLAHVARGHFHAIAEGASLWEDRDLSNSSMERIAVPGLAATVEHMLRTMEKVMGNLRVNLAAMQVGAADPRTRTNILQVLAQKHFELGPVEAGRLVREFVQWDGDYLQYSSDIADEFGRTREEVDRWWDAATELWDGLVYP